MAFQVVQNHLSEISLITPLLTIWELKVLNCKACPRYCLECEEFLNKVLPYLKTLVNDPN